MALTNEDRAICETVAALVHGYWMEDNETIFCPGRKPERMENPLTSADTCIAAWRELGEKQKERSMKSISMKCEIATTWTLLDNPDAARILATEIAKMVTP